MNYQDIYHFVDEIRVSSHFKQGLVTALKAYKNPVADGRLVFKQIYMDSSRSNNTDFEIGVVLLEDFRKPNDFEAVIMVENVDEEIFNSYHFDVTSDKPEHAVILRLAFILFAQTFENTFESPEELIDKMRVWLKDETGNKVAPKFKMEDYNLENHFEMIEPMIIDNRITDKNMRNILFQDNLMVEKAVMLVTYFFMNSFYWKVEEVTILTDQQSQSCFIVLYKKPETTQYRLSYRYYVEKTPLRYMLHKYTLDSDSCVLLELYSDMKELTEKIIAKDEEPLDFGDDSSLLLAMKDIENRFGIEAVFDGAYLSSVRDVLHEHAK